MSRYFINAIYRATEGEGIWVGTSQVFVRFQGCSIGCLNCDSKDTWEFVQDGALSLESVLEQISQCALQGAIKRVSITGGDPLHPKHEKAVLELVRALKERRYFVSLEAAGTRIVDGLFDLLDYINFDYKTPSTGVKTRLELIEKLQSQYQGKFQVKAVVENDQDFNDVFAAYQSINEKNPINFPWCLTPAYNLGEDFPQKRFARVIELNEKAGGVFRVIGQQHKWIHGPDKKKV